MDIGLDIGSYSIKIASLARSKGEKILTAYNIKKIPPGENSSKLAGHIREVLDEVDLHPDSVNMAISGPDVIVRFITLPKMNRDQLKDALVFEAEKYIPFNINEVVLDFIILADAPEAGQMRVLLAAAKREPVEGIIKMAEGAGISLNVMDIGSFAMFNAFMEANPTLEEKGNAFLDFGHSQTNVLVAIGTLPCFMRQVQIGGKDIGSSAKAAPVPEESPAEKTGVLIGGPSDAGDRGTQVDTASLDELVKEIRLSFGYFENRHNRAVEGIYCSGGMTYNVKAIEYLSARIGIQVKKWDPIKGMKISEDLSKEDIDSVSSQFAVSIGLALRA